jgi:hypothetical protein
MTTMTTTTTMMMTTEGGGCNRLKRKNADRGFICVFPKIYAVLCGLKRPAPGGASFIFLDGGVRCGKPRNGYAERRAAYVV